MLYKGIFVCLIFLSFPSFSLNSSHYKSKLVPTHNLTEQSIQRYVIPQLNGIVQDFYQIIKKTDPFSDNLINLKQATLKLFYQFQLFAEQCSTLAISNCNNQLAQIYQSTKNVDKISLSLQKESSLFSILKKQKDYQPSALMTLITDIDNISNLIYKINHIIEEMLLYSLESSSPYKIETDQLLITFNQLKISSETLVLNRISDEHQKFFDQVFSLFILKIEEHLVFSRSFDQFINRIDELNIIWNSFHKVVSKGKVKFSGNILFICGNIHARWNSILKMLIKS